MVLDGSIEPASLGINPTLTIAALARRAVQALRPGWNLGEAQASQRGLGPRPVLRKLPDPVAPQRTKIELVERMRGPVPLARQPRAWAELTLFSQPTPLHGLMQGKAPRQLTFDVRAQRAACLGERAGANRLRACSCSTNSTGFSTRIAPR